MGQTKPSAIFLDLDGTLWDREVVPDSAWQAIEKARENGHRIFINTGRKADSIPDFLWEANFDGYGLSNGMDLHVKNQPRIQYAIPLEQLNPIVDFLQRHLCGYSLETADTEYDDFKYALRRRLYLGLDHRQETMNRHRLVTMPPAQREKVVKISFDNEKEIPLEELAGKYNYDLLTYRNRYNPLNGLGEGFKGELTTKEHNKATAMKELMELAGLDPANWRLCAIGDQDNDIPMFQAADTSVAMGDGSEKARKAAQWITANLEEDGLAKAFAHLGVI